MPITLILATPYFQTFLWPCTLQSFCSHLLFEVSLFLSGKSYIRIKKNSSYKDRQLEMFGDIFLYFRLSEKTCFSM